MSDSFLDHIPSTEKQRLLKRLRSPEAYEKLRESVKGPEDLERELEKMDAMAEMHFALESDPHLQETMKKAVIEIMKQDPSVSPEIQKALESENFKLTVSAHPKTHQDQVMIIPEGNVQEKIPVTQKMNDQLMSQFIQSK